MIDCLLIVVSYRSGPDLARLLSTVPDAAGGLSWHAIVVNNEPAEDLTPIAAAHPDVKVLDVGANVGYAGGINRALAVAPPSRWIAFLNPDITLAPGSLDLLTQLAADVRAVAPAIVDETGERRPSIRREPSILGSFGDAVLGGRWVTRPASLSETVRSRAAYESPGPIDWATGAALLLPSSLATEVGAWDEQRFFLYSEETDYCRRIRARGTQIYYLPEAVVTHRGAGSGSSDALHALLEVNRVRYFHKWHGSLAITAFTGVVVLNNVLRWRRPRSRAALRALLRPSARSALPGGPR